MNPAIDLSIKVKFKEEWSKLNWKFIYTPTRKNCLLTDEDIKQCLTKIMELFHKRRHCNLITLTLKGRCENITFGSSKKKKTRVRFEILPKNMHINYDEELKELQKQFRAQAIRTPGVFF